MTRGCGITVGAGRVPCVLCGWDTRHALVRLAVPRRVGERLIPSVSGLWIILFLVRGRNSVNRIYTKNTDSIVVAEQRSTYTIASRGRVEASSSV